MHKHASISEKARKNQLSATITRRTAVGGCFRLPRVVCLLFQAKVSTLLSLRHSNTTSSSTETGYTRFWHAELPNFCGVVHGKVGLLLRVAILTTCQVHLVL